MIDKLALSLSWQSANLENLPTLRDDEVHVFCLPLALENEQADIALTWLNDLQKERYARRSTEEAKAVYLAGRYFLLGLLSAYTASPPEQISLSYSRLNKPSLSDRAFELDFNFTDTQYIGTNGQTQAVGLFAFSRRRELGVDIEALSRNGNFEAIVERRFSDREKAAVMDAAGRINSARFLSIWTRKEASGKATGQGINFKMRERNLFEEDSPILNYSDENNRDWRLIQLRIHPSLIACIVHAEHTPTNIKAFNTLTT